MLYVINDPSGTPLILDGSYVDRDGNLTITASMPNQELDTLPTTGVMYWEGEVVVVDTRDGEPISGHSYVELTGCAHREPIGTTT